MPSMILPKHVAEERRRQQQEAAAATISKSAVHRFDSDDWATPKDVADQIAALSAYINERREVEPTYAIPAPTGWKIMVLMLTIPERSIGGVFVTDEAKEARALSSPQGVVLAVGPGAYTDADRFTVNGEIEPWCRKGDRVTFVKYDAHLFQIANGQRFGFLNDTQPVSVIDSGWEVPE